MIGQLSPAPVIVQGATGRTGSPCASYEGIRHQHRRLCPARVGADSVEGVPVFPIAAPPSQHRCCGFACYGAT